MSLDRFSRPALFVAIVVLVGVIVAVWPRAGEAPPTGNDVGDAGGYGVAAPPPASIEVLLDHLTAVVVGRYAEVVDVLPPTPPGEAISRSQTGGTPTTLYRFEVDHYIVGTGPAELTVARAGDAASASQVVMPVPTLGEQITLVTAPWTVDGRYFVSLFGYGELTEDAGEVDFAFPGADGTVEVNSYLSECPPFATGMSMAEFHQAIQDAARERGLAVPD